MALQFEVESLEGIDEAHQPLYEKSGEKYRLAVEGIDDGAELKGALEKERAERRKAKERLKELEDEKRTVEEAAEQARLEAAKKGGDYETLEKSWQEKLDRQKSELEEQLNGYRATVEGLTVGQTATRLSSELAVQGSASVLEPHIKGRLKTEYVDGQPKTVVLDKEGKPSAMSVDELKAEIQNDPAFAPLIVGSKASGAGHRPGESGGAAKKTITRSDFESLPADKRMAWVKEHGSGSIVNE